MAAVAKLGLQLVFADNETKTININNVNPTVINSATAIANIIAKVKAFNNAEGGTLATKVLSSNGFNWIGIKKATITTTETTYIY